jgi:DNA-binding NarL/FixJ family response regulator
MTRGTESTLLQRRQMSSEPSSGHGADATAGQVEAVTCVVADDHPAVLDAVSQFLSHRGISVIGRAADGEEALEQIEQLQPAVALVDVRMPKLDGIDLVRRARVSSPRTSLLLYTGFSDRALLTEALDAGAQGFVLKEAPLDDLLRAVTQVAAGGTYVDPVLAGTLAISFVGNEAAQLTPGERDVLRLLADGLANEEIGQRLHISAETVRKHIRKAMVKLDADTRTQAVAVALRERLIQ